MSVRNVKMTKASEIYTLPNEGRWARCSARWQARLDCHSGQEAHFAVTGDIWETAKGRNRGWVSAGMLHDDLRDFAQSGGLRGNDAILPELTRWHLCAVRSGPMHYVPNGLYWLKRHLRSIRALPGPRASEHYLASLTASEQERDRHALESFKRAIVFGALADDEIPVIPDFGPNKFAGAEGTEADKSDAWIVYCESEIERVICPWLEARLPRLMAAFEADMVRWFGPEIVEPETA